MEVTGTVGKMGGHRCRCCEPRHGKDITEQQHTKNKTCRNKHETLGIKKYRWNKKKGILEKSHKHSRISRWLY